VIRVLLRAVERYFRTQKDIQSVVAFHPHTGYPVWADGRGAVMHHQWSLMEALGNAGFHLTERWLFFSKVFNALIPEHLPALPGVRLVWDDVGDTDVGMLAFSGQDVVARARFVILPRCNGDFRPDTASLFYLEVCAAYRRQGLGHWLFERGINRLVDRGVYRLLIDVSHQDTLFQSRLRRLGFYEQPQRGYTYIKKL
jgi:ribosomal protein S18 acetylase RimI-like enzyme